MQLCLLRKKEETISKEKELSKLSLSRQTALFTYLELSETGLEKFHTDDVTLLTEIPDWLLLDFEFRRASNNQSDSTWIFIERGCLRGRSRQVYSSSIKCKII